MWTLFIVTVLLTGDGEVMKSQYLEQYATKGGCDKNAQIANVSVDVSNDPKVAISAVCIKTIVRRKK